MTHRTEIVARSLVCDNVQSMSEYKILKKAETRKEWLMLRQLGIGGSDAAAIMGMNRYKKRSDVFRDKMSHDLNEFSNAAMRFGTVFESYILERIRPEYAWAHVEPGDDMGTLHHKVRQWQLANIDGMLVKDGEPYGVGLEIKTCAERSYYAWRQGPPPMYHAQVQHYMSVMGWDRFDIWLCVSCGDRATLLDEFDHSDDPDGFGTDLIRRCIIERHEVLRNDAFISRMNADEEKFWDLVQSARKDDPYFDSFHVAG